MLDERPIEVEAEVIEEGMTVANGENALAVDVESIARDIAAMNESVQGVEKIVGEYEITDEALQKIDMKEVKAHAAALNKHYEGYETARKSLKAHLMDPYKGIEAKGKQLMAPVVELRDRYKAEAGGRAERKKALLRQGLEGTYRQFAEANGFGELVNVVPFDRIIAVNPKWLNASYGAAKAAEEIEDAAAGIAMDWKAFKALDVPFKDEAEAVFFRELSLKKAIEFVEERKADQERIEALRAEVAENRGECAPEFEPAPDTAPCCPTNDIVTQAEQHVAAVCSKPVEVYVLALEMTAHDKERLKGYMVANDIHGRLAKSGFASAESAMECMKGVIANG